MKLTKEELGVLINELKIASVMDENEMKYIKNAHPQLYYTVEGKRGDNVSISTEKSYIYSLNNYNLKKILCEKFNEDIKNVYSIHKLIYGVGGNAKKHRDRFTTHKTVSIILPGNFKGGEMFINDEIVEMFNPGDYIVFDGSKDLHEVKEITEGKREVLIIWFSKKPANFNII